MIATKPIPSSASGERLPVVGLGTWKAYDAGGSAAERAPLEAAVRELANGGGRVMDSSPMYGRAEEVVGSVVGSRRGPPRSDATHGRSFS